MKTFLRLAFFSAISIITFSCQKEISNNQQNLNQATVHSDAISGTGECERRWFGEYSNGINPDDTITQKDFIANGVAQLPPVDWYNYHTGIFYDIPLCHEISADCIRFDVRLKNPNNVNGAIYGYDVALQLYGSDKTYGTDKYSEIYLVGDPTAQAYTHIWIGNEKMSNIPELVHYFGDYQTLSLELKNSTLNIYIDGSLIKSLPYDISTHLGKLKRIGIGFKGTGTADWVKLFSSSTGNQIMQEDFDLDGKSNVIWF